MSLLSIPREILFDIVTLLSTNPPTPLPSPDVLKLAQTCQQIRSVCLPSIYSTITTSTSSGKLERLLADYPSIAAYVRTLTVHAPEHRYADMKRIGTALAPFPLPNRNPPLELVPKDPPCPVPEPKLLEIPETDPPVELFPDRKFKTPQPAPKSPPQPIPWVKSVLQNCTGLQELILEQPRSRALYGVIPVNFREEFLTYLAPASLRTITTVRLRGFRVAGLLSQFKRLLEGGFDAIETLSIEKFNMNNPPSFQEGERLKKNLEAVVSLTETLQMQSVKRFTLDAPITRPAHAERSIGELFARALPAVRVLSVKTGADCIHSMLKTYAQSGSSLLREITLEVMPPCFKVPGSTQRDDFCGILVRLSPKVEKLVLGCKAELRVCEKMLVEADWLLLKEMNVSCDVGCEGVKLDRLKKSVEERSLKRGRVSVSIMRGRGYVVCDNHGGKGEAPVEMFRKLALSRSV